MEAFILGDLFRQSGGKIIDLLNVKQSNCGPEFTGKIDFPATCQLPENLIFMPGIDDSADVVNRPAHYTAGRYETIDIIESICESQDLRPMEAVYLANVVKYISRFKHKNGVIDLRKAAWYLDRLIKEQGTPDSRATVAIGMDNE